MVNRQQSVPETGEKYQFQVKACQYVGGGIFFLRIKGHLYCFQSTEGSNSIVGNRQNLHVFEFHAEIQYFYLSSSFIAIYINVLKANVSNSPTRISILKIAGLEMWLKL
jgi:hypothetical protein